MLIQDTNQHKYNNVFLEMKYHLAWIFEQIFILKFHLRKLWKSGNQTFEFETH